jgi:hypothetical protein
MTFSITCTPREGYVAIRYNSETKERDEDNRYVFVKKTGTDELWMVCMRGDNAGEALKESEVNGDEWMVDDFFKPSRRLTKPDTYSIAISELKDKKQIFKDARIETNKTDSI